MGEKSQDVFVRSEEGVFFLATFEEKIALKILAA
jgi:hypothetical protein